VIAGLARQDDEYGQLDGSEREPKSGARDN
jgi:hypothetical protein